MPDLKRIPVKLNCKGVDLAHTVDQLAENFYARLNNVRELQQGEIQARPGTAAVNAAATTYANVHTLRRINNLLPGASPDWALLVGDGTELTGGQAAFTPAVTGFSGNPLTIIPFRPETSPETWAYVGDSTKMAKLNTALTARNVGILPPATAPTPEYDQPALAVVQNATGAWTSIGPADTLTAANRFNTTINIIVYDSGSTGWCCISPVNGDGYFNERCMFVLGGSETVFAREVWPELPTTTVQSISYDSGTTGACSIVLAINSFVDAPPPIGHNTLIQVGAEVVRVLAAVKSTDGTKYSIRCSTASNHAAGEAVIGMISLRCYTGGTFAAGNTLIGAYIGFNVNASAGTSGGVTATPQTVDLSKWPTSQRLFDLANDYLHISIYCAAPGNIVSGKLLIDVDTAGTIFTQNYYQADLSAALFTQSGQGWNEIVIPMSEMTRVGGDLTKTLAVTRTVGVEFVVTATTGFEIAGWYFFGTYGTDSGTSNPTGASWRYRYRDSRTGAKSLPSPAPYYHLFPEREAVNVRVFASSDAQVDTIDYERLGAGLDTYTYLGSSPNANGVFFDSFDALSVDGNPSLETDVFAPFLSEDKPWSGTVNVVGTSVTWVSGTTFNTALAPGTEIEINGVATQLYTTPASTTRLTLVASLGTLTAVPYKITSPALMGQPLPTLIGPLEGPTASYVFGLGDPRNPGLLYWMNGNDPDSMGQANFLEITPPSEPLVCGAVWNTMVFVASRKRVFLVQPSYTQSGNLFIQTQITSESGCYSPWGMAAGVDGVYMLGRDGVYLITAGGANYLSKALWPLWAHEGKPAQLTNGYYPVDMTQQQYLRVEYADSSIYLTCKDTNGSLVSWRMSGEGLGAVFSGDPAEFRRGWFWEQYNPAVQTHYFEEVGTNTVAPRLLKGTVDGHVVAAGSGTTDSGNTINCLVRTGSNDLGDPRTQKLYMDVMTELAGTATLTLGFNRFSTTLAAAAVTSVARGLAYTNVMTLSPASLVLYEDIAAQWEFTPGTLLYEYQPSFYVQPFYGYELTMQLGDCGIPGWKQLRYYRMAVVSTGAVTLTIINDDGVTLASIPVTATTSGALLMSFGNLPNAAKGRLLRFSLTCATPFAAFPEDCFVRIKKWGGKQFVDLRPFIDG